MKKKTDFSELEPLQKSKIDPGDVPSPTDETPSEEPPQKGPGLLYHLFSPETRLGRFMRPFSRILGVIVGLFAVGFFTAYFLLYQPRLKEMNRAKADLETTTLKLNQTEGTLTAAQKYLNEANAKYEQAAADLKKERDHVALLTLVAEINNARGALAAKDGAEARLSLQNSQKLLDAYLPAVKAHSAEIADSFDTRLTLVINEFSRDPETALTDLELLADSLLDLEKVLYK